MIKLIVSDMDGTLLNEEIELSDENLAAIKDAQAHGIHFAIATGRDYQTGYTIVQERGINCSFFGLNGAIGYDEEGNRLYTKNLKPSTVQTLLHVLDRDDVHVNIMTDKGVYSTNYEREREYLRHVLSDINKTLAPERLEEKLDLFLEQHNITYLDNFQELIRRDDEEILKVSAQTTAGEEMLTELKDSLLQAADDIVITASSAMNLEINHKDATKGFAVATYARELGIDHTEVLTIGDNINDLSMLEWAEHGTAMANAAPEAKETAAYETGSNSEHGVAQIINRVLAGEIY
ncbi:Cof-type HAD-IIB family hydrolase [Dolosigranulum pigrum]|jgi:cof-like hydrolase|uniref:Cof-type HAD-IIB family hydrolase n=1 Tax=Dolosigranulum pigrum TaxID=29394 RepID=UPI000DC259BB|nr:Cof-type HAD-IIB family hydrolase [Dolosigranulum pigrum]QJS97687.1 HAD family phosphatase [Dolosigranulum pigrum]